jgi:hypothetical protein
MAYDTIEAHQETIVDLRTQLAKANEREKDFIAYMHDAQKWFDKHDPNGYLQSSHPKAIKALNKFAIEKKIEAINEAFDYYEELKASEEPIGAGSILHVCLGRLISQQKQLRKEQGSE